MSVLSELIPVILLLIMVIAVSYAFGELEMQNMKGAKLKLDMSA